MRKPSPSLRARIAYGFVAIGAMAGFAVGATFGHFQLPQREAYPVTEKLQIQNGFAFEEIEPVLGQPVAAEQKEGVILAQWVGPNWRLMLELQAVATGGGGLPANP